LSYQAHITELPFKSYDHIRQFLGSRTYAWFKDVFD
jgi:hypothetical protein